MSLTTDGDQLTSRWTAGAYRAVTRKFAELAVQEEDTILVDPAFLARIGKSEISVPQPTLLWLERPETSPDCDVFDDLVLPVTVDPKVKWRLVSLLDTPIVQAGNQFCALSGDLRTIAVIDDYMLRLAARIDPNQYSRATTAREERMIGMCRRAFEECSHPWEFRVRVHLDDPPQEVDVLASREGLTLAIQLKSTLRPETPWEVYKRNEAVISGLQHTRRLVDRGAAETGILLTDGYRGDYQCWATALAYDIPIATIHDLEALARDPLSAAVNMKSRVGITASPTASPGAISDREGHLVGWTLRLIDGKPPQQAVG